MWKSIVTCDFNNKRVHVYPPVATIFKENIERKYSCGVGLSLVHATKFWAEASLFAFSTIKWFIKCFGIQSATLGKLQCHSQLLMIWSSLYNLKISYPGSILYASTWYWWLTTALHQEFLLTIQSRSYLLFCAKGDTSHTLIKLKCWCNDTNRIT